MADVDAALVRLARERGASLVTTDHNLSKVAEARRGPGPAAERPRRGVPPARSASATRSRCDWSSRGASPVRRSGYLEDGTMVVVESAGERIGSERPIVVRNVIKTATGRMVFANLQ